MKSGNLNFLESSGPLQACNGTAFTTTTTAATNATIGMCFHKRDSSALQTSELTWFQICYTLFHAFSEARGILCFFGLPAKIFPYSGSREGKFQKHCYRVPKFDVIIYRRHVSFLFWTVVNTMNKQ